MSKNEQVNRGYTINGVGAGNIRVEETPGREEVCISIMDQFDSRRWATINLNRDQYDGLMSLEAGYSNKIEVNHPKKPEKPGALASIPEEEG
jgi:hypothetical protein